MRVRVQLPQTTLMPINMSLRIRLVLLIVVLVAAVAIAVSLVHLANLADLLSTEVLEHSKLAADQAKAFVTDRIRQKSEAYPAPSDMDAVKALWTGIVSADPDIPTMLVNMLKLSPAIEDINIAGPAGTIVASSNPLGVGKPMVTLSSFADWSARPFYRRLWDLILREARPDYQFLVPLGVKGEAQPLFRIQVIVSSALLRAAVVAQIATLGYVSGAALLLSVLITLLASNRVLRPLKRIEATIDRIVQGNFLSADTQVNPAPEFAAVEGKLNVLGEEFRGAREQAVELQNNLDGLLDRMATELDVASRLAAISRITSGVAHEIKNPLNAISLRLDLLRARLGEPEEELLGEIDILTKEVRRLDRVVKTFLDFSKPVDVKLTEVDLASIAREVAELTTPQASLANIKVWFEAASEPALIRGDADMLKQAILNLVLNAIEAMKSGGNLWLRVSREGKVVALNVSDDGPGIPPEARDKVFQLYFTTKERGSGIGLAMTYRAVQLHNGTINFSTELGRGTSFQMQFPALVRHV
ncbi:MAG TPA: ATP-binding protein [Bryobacteraceae bacterium]|nr:ATP-binding protein [Bryobacteraceae bacterium]